MRCIFHTVTLALAVLVLATVPALGQQFVFPSVNEQGTWDTGGCHLLGDGVGSGDSTYCIEDDGSVMTCDTSWSGSTPDTGTHTLRCRVRITDGIGSCTFYAYLCDVKQCSSPRATLHPTFFGTGWATFGTTTVDVSGIDYSDLFIRVVADCDGTRDFELADCELETPDAPAGGRTRRMF